MAMFESTMLAITVTKVVITQESLRFGRSTVMELPFDWLETNKLPANSKLHLHLEKRGRFSQVDIIDATSIVFYDAKSKVLMTKKGAYMLYLDENEIFRGRRPQYYDVL